VSLKAAQRVVVDGGVAAGRATGPEINGRVEQRLVGEPLGRGRGVLTE
jgi:hypothetical protein